MLTSGDLKYVWHTFLSFNQWSKSYENIAINQLN